MHAHEPGSPWENGYVESFNGKLRDELLNGELLYALEEAKILIERWRWHYSTVRPRSAPGVAVLLPQQVWRRPVLRAAMRGASPRTRFLPIYQFNATVVNTHLKDYAETARCLQERSTGTPLGEWMSNLDGFNEANAWRYSAYLDDALT